MNNRTTKPPTDNAIQADPAISAACAALDWTYLRPTHSYGQTANGITEPYTRQAILTAARNVHQLNTILTKRWSDINATQEARQ